MKKIVSGILTAVIGIALTASVMAQSFGGAIALDGDQILVGETGNQSASSTVYLYTKSSTGEWMESGRLQASDADGADDRFGRAMAARNGVFVAGATVKDDNYGAAYVFERNDSGDWVEVAKLSPNENPESANFGRAIGINDHFVAISAAGFNESRGAVFMFKKSASGTWEHHSRLELAEGEPNSLYGLAIAMDGNRLIVGAQGSDENMGAAYAYTYNSATDMWDDKGEIQFNGVQDQSVLGAAIAIQGDNALVSAPGLGNGAVMMLAFDVESGSWNHVRTLNPFDGDRGNFGASLGFDGDDIWVGTPFAAQGTGAIYRFAVDESGSITAADKLPIEGVEQGWQFGTQFVVSDDLLVVGATGVDSGLGVGLAYEKGGYGWNQVGRFEAEVSGGMEAITGNEVRCDDKTAEGFGCEGVNMLSFLPIADIGGGRGTRLNDTWGWTDESTGREYAIIGRIDGTSFIDITDAMNPNYLGDLPKTAGTPSASWRDMKVYQDHVYIVADGAGNHGIQIFDLTELRDVPNAPVTFEETAHYDGIASAHNIVINEATGFAYTVGNQAGGETCGGGSHILDLSNATEPVFVGCFGHEGTGRAGTGYSHDSMCVTYHGPDSAHSGKEICIGSNETAISIADLTDKSNPIELSIGEYPNVGYAHQGWISEDHKYFYSNDELDEVGGNAPLTRTLIWDIADLDDPILVKEWQGTTAASDHNMYIKGQYMYQSNYNAGLRILDISNPEEPVEVAYFDTQPNGEDAAGFNGSWSNYPYFQSGTLIVTSIREGVFFLKKQDIDI